ncbi:unnamed protein product [Rotaria sp. Silwood2]|nr:unnamed protein product [Rotaria sp. Silwood2]
MRDRDRDLEIKVRDRDSRPCFARDWDRDRDQKYQSRSTLSATVLHNTDGFVLIMLPIECGELTNQMCLLGCLIALVDETWKASDLDLIQHMNVDMLKLPRLLNDTYLEEFTDLQKQPNAKSSGSPCSIKHLRKKNFVDTLKRQLHAQVSGKQAGGIESAAVVAFVK